MINGQLLSEVIHQESRDPVKLAYLCGIDHLWEKVCGVEKFTPRQIDRMCTVLRITPDLRREIFGEEAGDG